MSSAKDEVQAVLKDVSDDATMEEIVYRLYVRHKVREGIVDADAGRTLSQHEVEQRVQSWRERSDGRK